jgi:TonB family protein
MRICEKKHQSILTFFICLCVVFNHAQSTETRFFSNRFLNQEVPPRKAKFSQTISGESDGRVTTEVKDLKKNEIIRRETYKGEEPFGIWFYKGNDGHDLVLDYEFELVYTDKKFDQNEADKALGDLLKDNDSLGYKAPKIFSGEKNIGQFVIKYLNYPARAREEGIQGRVELGFKITKEGDVDEFVIYRGAHILLDKEAVRVMRKLKLSGPALLKGEPTGFKVRLPITYNIR